MVGLAPGLRGANRTGRPFTGDYAGGLLYATLRKYGFAEGDYDEGVIRLTSSKDAAEFVGELGKLRVWGREPNVKMK